MRRYREAVGAGGALSESDVCRLGVPSRSSPRGANSRTGAGAERVQIKLVSLDTRPARDATRSIVAERQNEGGIVRGLVERERQLRSGPRRDRLVSFVTRASAIPCGGTTQ